MRAFAARIFSCTLCYEVARRYEDARPALVSAIADVAAPVAHFVSFEMRDAVDRPGRPFATRRMRTMVSVLRIEVIVHVPMKIRGAVKPRANADEHAVREPGGAVISIGRTIVGCVIVISIGAIRRRADVDCNLSLTARGTGCKK